MTPWAHPNYHFIQSHQQEIDKWKAEVFTNMHKNYRRFGHLEPIAFIFGYNYVSGRYENVVNTIDPNILKTPEHKEKLYIFLNNIDHTVPFQPLALILLTPMVLVKSDTDTREDALLVIFNTRLTYRRYVYRHETNEEGEKHLQYEQEYSKLRLGPEIGMFEKVFVTPVSEN